MHIVGWWFIYSTNLCLLIGVLRPIRLNIIIAAWRRLSLYTLVSLCFLIPLLIFASSFLLLEDSLAFHLNLFALLLQILPVECSLALRVLNQLTTVHRHQCFYHLDGNTEAPLPFPPLCLPRSKYDCLDYRWSYNLLWSSNIIYRIQEKQCEYSYFYSFYCSFFHSVALRFFITFFLVENFALASL